MKRLELFLNRLYQRAKDDPYRRFHSLHDKICRLDVLEEAWKSVEANHGAAGIDGNTIEDIREYGVQKFLSELREELIGGRYEVSSLRRVYIPKANGKQRPLGIPTVKDRIVQQAVKMIKEPLYVYAYYTDKPVVQESGYFIGRFLRRFPMPVPEAEILEISFEYRFYDHFHCLLYYAILHRWNS